MLLVEGSTKVTDKRLNFRRREAPKVSVATCGPKISIAWTKSDRYCSTTVGVKAAVFPLATAISYATVPGTVAVGRAAGADAGDRVGWGVATTDGAVGVDGAGAAVGWRADGGEGGDGATVPTASAAELVYEHAAYMYNRSCKSISSGGSSGTRMYALLPLQQLGSLLLPPKAGS